MKMQVLRVEPVAVEQQAIDGGIRLEEALFPRDDRTREAREEREPLLPRGTSALRNS